jgi:hypothetical protein
MSGWCVAEELRDAPPEPPRMAGGWLGTPSAQPMLYARPARSLAAGCAGMRLKLHSACGAGVGGPWGGSDANCIWVRKDNAIRASSQQAGHATLLRTGHGVCRAEQSRARNARGLDKGCEAEHSALGGGGQSG